MIRRGGPCRRLPESLRCGELPPGGGGEVEYGGIGGCLGVADGDDSWEVAGDFDAFAAAGAVAGLREFEGAYQRMSSQMFSISLSESLGARLSLAVRSKNELYVVLSASFSTHTVAAMLST